LHANAGDAAADVGNRLKSAQADLVLLSAPKDSAWFESVATASGLHLIRPGHTGPTTLGLLTNLKSVGDTALSLAVPNGGRLHMKDALYEVDKDRTIDLILVSFADVTGVREAVRTLLNYIATDVGGTSAVVLGIDAPTAVAGDSASTLMRAAFANALECGTKPTPMPANGLGMNLFWGPEARLSCTGSHINAGTPNAVVARVVVER
jgi:hypothetical protein